MSTIRIQKHEKNFVILDTTCLNDQRLSFRARGLHAYLMSKPDDWSISLIALERESDKEGREAIRTAMHELIDLGYAERIKVRNQHGKLCGSETVIYEKPSTIAREPVEPNVGFPDDRFARPSVEDPPTKDCKILGLKEVRIEKKEYSPKKESYPGAVIEDDSTPGPLPASAASGNGVGLAKKQMPIPLKEDDWLRELLLDYTLLDFGALNDDEWWIDVSQPLAGVFGKQWLEIEFSKVSAYLRENPMKKPASASGWKRFIRSWLHRSYEYNRRYNVYAKTSKHS